MSATDTVPADTGPADIGTADTGPTAAATPGARAPWIAAGLAWAGIAALALAASGPLGPAAFLPFALPIAIWVAWSDMARMKIPNKAVLALVLVYAAVGPLALPLEDYAWRWLHLAVVLVIGFLGNMLRAFGAGDAKFAAAMAPFVAPGDVAPMLYLFAAMLLAAVAVHRIARAIPVVRRAAPHWESWTRADFPMGLALSGALLAYLALAGL